MCLESEISVKRGQLSMIIRFCCSTLTVNNHRCLKYARGEERRGESRKDNDVIRSQSKEEILFSKSGRKRKEKSRKYDR